MSVLEAKGSGRARLWLRWFLEGFGEVAEMEGLGHGLRSSKFFGGAGEGSRSEGARFVTLVARSTASLARSVASLGLLVLVRGKVWCALLVSSEQCWFCLWLWWK